MGNGNFQQTEKNLKGLSFLPPVFVRFPLSSSGNGMCVQHGVHAPVVQLNNMQCVKLFFMNIHFES